MADRGHVPIQLGRGRTSHWPYCKRCGLIYLKNEATRKAIKARCPADLDKE